MKTLSIQRTLPSMLMRRPFTKSLCFYLEGWSKISNNGLGLKSPATIQYERTFGRRSKNRKFRPLPFLPPDEPEARQRADEAAEFEFEKGGGNGG